MVKFDLVLTKGKIHVETIDDAEGTPGSSRQYTRFNSQCKPALERLGEQYDSNDSHFTEHFDFTLGECQFFRRSVEQVKDEKGNPTNRVRVIVDSVET